MKSPDLNLRRISSFAIFLAIVVAMLFVISSCKKETAPREIPLPEDLNIVEPVMMNNSGGSEKTAVVETKSPAITPPNVSPDARSGQKKPIITAKPLTFGKMDVFFINVGDGSSTLIRTPLNRYVLIDGGNRSESARVLGIIRSMNISGIDVIISTHPELFHTAGLINIMGNTSFTYIIDNGQPTDYLFMKDYYLTIKDTGHLPKYLRLEYDTELDIDPMLKIRLIAPYYDYSLKNISYSEFDDDNSIVVKITHNNISFLFMGDCNTPCEKAISGRNLSADVLLAGNHGMKTASSEEFLREVGPKTVIVSAGVPLNQQSHVIDRVEGTGAGIFNTHDYGDIVVESNGTNYTLLVYKEVGGQKRWVNITGI